MGQAERLGDNLLSVTLYGSRARGDAEAGSDFDLIVKVRLSSSDIREMVLATDVEMMNEFERHEQSRISRTPNG